MTKASERISDIKKRLENSTPGSWHFSRDLMVFEVYAQASEDKDIIVDICKVESDDFPDGTHDDVEFYRRYNNADLIANAPSDLAFLLRSYDKLLEANEKLVAALEYIQLVHINKIEKAIKGEDLCEWAFNHNSNHAKKALAENERIMKELGE